MRIVIFSKYDVIGLTNTNIILNNLNEHITRVEIYLSNYSFPNERGFEQSDNLIYCEQDFPREDVFPFIDENDIGIDARLRTFRGIELAYGIKIKIMDKPIQEKILTELREFAPDIIISSRHDFIFPKDCLNIPKIGIYNTHPGELPEFRGVNTPFWAMCEKRKVAVCSVHNIDPTIDTGDILISGKFELDYSRSLLWNTTMIYQQGIRQFCKILKEFLENPQTTTMHGTPQDHTRRRVFYAPSQDEFTLFQEKGYKITCLQDYYELLSPFVTEGKFEILKTFMDTRFRCA